MTNPVSEELYRLNGLLNELPAHLVPELQFNGRPSLQVYSLEPLSYEKFSTFRRGPHLVGDFTVRAILEQEASQRTSFAWVVFEAGSRQMFGHRLGSVALVNSLGAAITRDSTYNKFCR